MNADTALVSILRPALLSPLLTTISGGNARKPCAGYGPTVEQNHFAVVGAAGLRLLYGSLIQSLQDHGFVAARDFDAVPCDDATLKDISTRKVRWFIEKARAERSYALAPDTPRKEVLAHLNLLAKGRPTRGAILLFRECLCATVRSVGLATPSEGNRTEIGHFGHNEQLRLPDIYRTYET